MSDLLLPVSAPVPVSVPDPLPDNASNRWRTMAFRDALLVEMHAAGLTDASRPPSAGSPWRDSGTILGLPFHLTTHRQATIELGPALDAAEVAAREAGTDLWATVHHRRGHALMDAYVTVPLRVFVTLVRKMPT